MGSHEPTEDEEYLRRFQNGDRLAVLECVVVSELRNAPIPQWARKELARVAERYLWGASDTLDIALFGARRPVGRNSKPATQRQAKHGSSFVLPHHNASCRRATRKRPMEPRC